MTDNDRNMRTLVVCFVLALAVLVPLKVLQGNSVMIARQADVLGETEKQEGQKMELIYGDEQKSDQVLGEEDQNEGSEVVLPDADVPVVVETEE